VLALGLGVVFSDVNLHTSYHSVLAHTFVVGLVVSRDHINNVCGVAATVYRREQDPQQFGQKLNSEDRGVWSGRGHLEDPLARKEGPWAIHGGTQPGAWPLQGVL
jgi:hypothetical protein